MARSPRPRRVLALSSGGGHWIQMQRLSGAFADFDTAYACVFPDYADDVPGHRFYTIADVTRRNMHMLFVLVPQLIGLILKERPDVVVTTGALPGFTALAVAKLLGVRRKIWIDSIANAERLSSSGRQARHVADEWITQWEHLAGPDGPRFLGAVL